MINSRIYEKEVKPWGTNGAHVTVTKKLIGKTVFIVDQDIMIDLEELIKSTLLLRKMDMLERGEFSKRFDTFKTEVGERLLRIEKAIFH